MSLAILWNSAGSAQGWVRCLGEEHSRVLYLMEEKHTLCHSQYLWLMVSDKTGIVWPMKPSQLLPCLCGSSSFTQLIQLAQSHAVSQIVFHQCLIEGISALHRHSIFRIPIISLNSRVVYFMKHNVNQTQSFLLQAWFRKLVDVLGLWYWSRIRK